MKFHCTFSILLVAGLLGGCASLLDTNMPTPLPEEYIPTIIALTLQAGQGEPAAPSPAAPEETQQGTLATNTPAPTGTPSPAPTPTPAATTAVPGESPDPFTPSPTPPGTPLPNVPDAAVQVYRPGELSKVTTPLQVRAYLRPGAVGVVRIELHGEDGRILVSEIKDFNVDASAWANLSFDLNFEIAAAAEAGRLVIRVDDEHGRTKAANSVDLILLSIGAADINPSDAVQEKIFIQQPPVKALIQGGTVMVSGLARPFTANPLNARLVTEENEVVGMDLIDVSILVEGGYGVFAAEVPYTVSEATPARLIIYEEGDAISEIRYLSSREIVLSP